MKQRLSIAVAIFLSSGLTAQDPKSFAGTYCDLIRKVNEEHARKPGKTTEADLKKRLPRQARAALASLLKLKDSRALFEALVSCGEAALDLDLIEDFEQIRSRLASAPPESAVKLGLALSRERFILRGIGGLDADYLQSFAGVLEAVLSAQDELFGFKEWSKVPGKKLRVRVHLEPKIERPPHFAPELPFHSEIDFPVADSRAFASPISDGKFLFYGLCHELGHVVAMWGSAQNEEDHHAWAHYTGTAVVEHLAEKSRDAEWMRRLSDARWRSLSIERKRLEHTEPSFSDRDGVLALFIALHDKVGSKAIGAAINHLDALDERLRIHRVRYYTFEQLKAGLLATLKDPKARLAVQALLGGAGTKKG